MSSWSASYDPLPPMRKTERAKPIQQIKTSVVYLVHHLSKYTNRRYTEMIHVYGQQQKGDQAKEGAEMSTFFNQLQKLHPDIHALAIHVRNEGKRDHKQIAVMKMQGGFVKGAPDIIIAGHPMFLCEMKSKSKSSRIAKEQTEFLERADKKGCFCCVAYGWESAMQAVEDWLKENPS